MYILQGMRLSRVAKGQMQHNGERHVPVLGGVRAGEQLSGLVAAGTDARSRGTTAQTHRPAHHILSQHVYCKLLAFVRGFTKY